MHGLAELDIKGLGLWPHQKDAVAMCLAYFASGSTRGALVQYPTGTGKTGIMATNGSLRARTAPVLIVCPSSALAGQLVREIAGNFWNRIAAPEAWRPETVLQLLPSDVEDAAARISGRAADERCIIVTTVQALQQIHTTTKRYAKLAGIFGTILFDEGHREPAPAWAKAVRGLSAPTVLFSAEVTSTAALACPVVGGTWGGCETSKPIERTATAQSDLSVQITKIANGLIAIMSV